MSFSKQYRHTYVAATGKAGAQFWASLPTFGAVEDRDALLVIMLLRTSEVVPTAGEGMTSFRVAQQGRGRMLGRQDGGGPGLAAPA